MVERSNSNENIQVDKLMGLSFDEHFIYDKKRALVIGCKSYDKLREMGRTRVSLDGEEDFKKYERYIDLESTIDDIDVNIAGLHRLGF